MRNRSRFRLDWLWALALVVLLPATSESYLKIKGFEDPKPALAEQRFAEWYADPVHRALGWDNPPESKRGTLAVDSAVPPDYKRLGQRRSNYLFLGCSCTWGVGLKDDEGFVYLLNQRYPQVNFDNYAVPGFGTYQLYRKLELVFQRNHNLYDGVVYCAINDHLRRNTWLNLAQAGNGLRFIVPRVIPLETGGYEYTDILPVPFWPGSRVLGRTLWFAQTVYIREYSHKPFPRSVDVPVFNDLLAKMAALCEAHQTKLLAVWLDCDLSRDLSAENRGRIRCLNVVFPSLDDPRFQVPGDGHPNAYVNRQWAEAIGSQLFGSDRDER